MRTPEEKGAAAVEFAIISGLLFTLLFGTIQYGLYFWSLQSGAQAAREAARQAAVGSLTCAQLSAAVLNNARGVQGAVQATRTFYVDETLATEASPALVGGAVRVSVSFNSIELGIPFMPFIEDGKVGEVSVARVENVTADSTKCP